MSEKKVHMMVKGTYALCGIDASKHDKISMVNKRDIVNCHNCLRIMHKLDAVDKEKKYVDYVNSVKVSSKQDITATEGLKASAKTEHQTSQQVMDELKMTVPKGIENDVKESFKGFPEVIDFAIDMEKKKLSIPSSLSNGFWNKENFKKVIHFNGMDFHFIVIPCKKMVKGWVDIKCGCTNKETYLDGKLTSVETQPITKHHEAFINLDDMDYFYPLTGIADCMLKLILKMEMSKYKKNSPHRMDWHSFKDYLNNEVTERRTMDNE